MIEINLNQTKKRGKLQPVMGMDISRINTKMLVIAVILAYVPGFFIEQYYETERNKIKVVKDKLIKQQKELDEEIKGFGNIKDQLKAFNEQIRKLKERSKQVDEIVKNKTNPKRLLEKLARSVPEDLWFDELKIDDKNTITIKGAANNYRSIGHFMTEANNSNYFGKSLSLADTGTKTLDDDKSEAKARYEVFEIKGKVVNYSPWVK